MKPKTLFMGTPEFSVPSLEGLVKAGYPVIGVVTQPDRPRGRGKKHEPPPVKTLAEELGLMIYQPEKVRDESFLSLFRELNPELVVLVAFGQILPREILESPPWGCVNVHPSLLPRYRGAAPINWALIRGEEKTGVTVLFMSEEVDAGDMILQEEVPIGPEDTYDSLHERLAEKGARLLVEAIGKIENGTAPRIPQEGKRATFAPKLPPDMGLINWDREGRKIVNLIRGLSAHPGAYTFLRGKKIKIYGASWERSGPEAGPGTVLAASDKGLPVVARDGLVYLRDVQLEGKKRMPVKDFLRGFRFTPGESFS